MGGSVRYFAHICFWAITDEKCDLAQPTTRARRRVSFMMRRALSIGGAGLEFIADPVNAIQTDGRRMKSISELVIGKQQDIVKQEAFYSSFSIESCSGARHSGVKYVITP